MSERDQHLSRLFQRIDELVRRSCTLPDGEEWWEQRLYIDFELLLLYRRVAALVAEDRPEASTP